MGGFEPPSTGQKLDFSETEHAGLEVTMGGIPLGDLLDIADLAETASLGEGARELVAKFAGWLESWNVTSGGEPVPPTLDGVRSLDAVFAASIIQAWRNSVMSAPPPLPAGSPSGGSSEEVPTGLAAASRSLRN